VYETYFNVEPVNLMGRILSPRACRRDKYRQRIAELELAAQKAPPPVNELLLRQRKWMGDPHMLRGAWERMAIRGGPSPGPNGRRYSDLEDEEVWTLMSTICRAIRGGYFSPGPVRREKIPKDPFDPERGFRTIQLLNIEDRTVQRLMVDLLQPVLEPLFSEWSFGFRPRRDRVQALALAYQLSVNQQRFAWAKEDIRNAFDNVPRGALDEVVSHYVQCSLLVDLIKRFVHSTPRRRGIPQGGPLSPLLLNLFLHHHLDRMWKKGPFSDVPLLRVADDLLLLCRSQEQAVDAWGHLNKLLRLIGMQPKHGRDESVVDLQTGKSVQWLGYRCRRTPSGMATSIARVSWNRLKFNLARAHQRPDSPLRAVAVIHAWVDQLGSAYSHVNRTEAIAKIARLAAALGFDEIPSPEAIRFRWLQAHLRWSKAIDKSDVDQSARSVLVKSLEESFETPTKGLCVDAAWSQRRRKMEYRGVWLHDNSIAFEVGPLDSGSNNLGEFLGITHAMRFLHRRGINCPIYSDSRVAIDWLNNRRVRSSAASSGALSSSVYLRLTRHLLWLTRNSPSLPVVKWDTKSWDEIPADYGRK